MTETPCPSETPETTDAETTRAEAAESGHAHGRELAQDGQAEPMVRWLEDEFPDWNVDIEPTATWEGDFQPLWIARRDGHHPQSELTAAKLHTRLTEYLERQSRRQALMN